MSELNLNYTGIPNLENVKILQNLGALKILSFIVSYYLFHIHLNFILMSDKNIT